MWLVHKVDNLTIFLCHCHEIWDLKFLEPPGPLQACNGLIYLYLFYVLDYQGLPSISRDHSNVILCSCHCLPCWFYDCILLLYMVTMCYSCLLFIVLYYMYKITYFKLLSHS